METVFWLLDINHEIIDEKPEIRLWGLDDENHRVLLIDRNFLPYFYLVIDEKANPSEVLKKVEKESSSIPKITKVEIVDKKYFGKPVKAIKVTCKDPDLTTKYALSLAEIPGVKEHLEDDVRYSSKYLVDNEVNPCGWHRVEVEEIKGINGARVDRIYLMKTTPKAIEKTKVPELRVLSFSIICYSPKGAPKPAKNPVVIISTATNTGENKQFIAENSSDREILNSFIEHVQNFDPDVIAGYGSNRQDWPYLEERTRKLGLKLLVDRCGTKPHTSLYGHISVTGRINIDFFDFAEDVQEVKVKTLENIADYLGVIKIEKRTMIEEMDIPAYWEDSKKRPILLKYSMENAESILGISTAMFDFAMQLSNLVGLPLDYVGTAAVGFRVEWYLIRQAFNLDELVPMRAEQPYFPYKGAIVLEPKPGLHEKVVVLDFKALYPNIMIVNNISPDTYLEPKEPEPSCGIHVAPEVKHRFRKEPPGFYKRVLSDLIAVRDEARKKLKTLDPKSPEYRILDARQKAIKVITNACYGYTGWIGARWYIRPVAEATTAWGRYTIKYAIDLAKKMGLEVIYGDTDSVFVKYDSEKTENFLNKVEKELGLEIKPDKIYERAFFTEAKKRYAGLLPDGRLDIVGLEVARGDWTEAAKNVQEKVLEIILKEKSPKKAAEFVRQYIADLKAEKTPYKDLIIWKTLTKPLDQYKVRTPHVEAAKILKKEGYELTIGDKIGFVLVKGPGKLNERSIPYILTTYDQLDLQYYVEQQVIPVATRILKLFDITKKDLMKPPEVRHQSSLSEFIK